LSRETASFRSVSNRTARQSDKALGSAAVAVVLNQAIERLYALPEVALPALPKDTSPERAASLVRMKWHLDDTPLKSMLQLLESKGVRIFLVACGCRRYRYALLVAPGSALCASQHAQGRRRATPRCRA
jgi:hypothetical protein